VRVRVPPRSEDVLGATSGGIPEEDAGSVPKVSGSSFEFVIKRLLIRRFDVQPVIDRMKRSSRRDPLWRKHVVS
jgi:hypothetical protein